MGRAPCCDKVGLKKGPWTPEEDEKLLSYIQQHGHGSWRALPQNAGLLRCGKSCRLRWTNYLRPDIKRGNFSVQEEQTIIQLHALLGNRWSTIATHLPKRTDNEIKNYWNTHLKKRLSKMGIDPVTHKPKSESLALAEGQSKSTSALSHMAQWESARLEAEARLAKQSRVRSRGGLFSSHLTLPSRSDLLTSTNLCWNKDPLKLQSTARCLDVLNAKLLQDQTTTTNPITMECSPTSTSSRLCFREGSDPAARSQVQFPIPSIDTLSEKKLVHDMPGDQDGARSPFMDTDNDNKEYVKSSNPAADPNLVLFPNFQEFSPPPSVSSPEEHSHSMLANDDDSATTTPSLEDCFNTDYLLDLTQTPNCNELLEEPTSMTKDYWNNFLNLVNSPEHHSPFHPIF